MNKPPDLSSLAFAGVYARALTGVFAGVQPRWPTPPNCPVPVSTVFGHLFSGATQIRLKSNQV